MIFTFLLSLIPIAVSSVLASLVSGGRIFEIIDFPDFLTVTVIFVACILISGYSKSFCTLFSSKEKYEKLTLTELQQTDYSFELGGKILLYTNLLFPILFAIYIWANFADYDRCSLGPDIAVFILMFVYALIYGMIICTAKAKVKKSIILYMAETDEKSGSSLEKIGKKELIKMIVGIVLLLLITYLTFAINVTGYYWREWSMIGSILDLPSILCILIYVLPLLAISGNFRILLKSIKAAFVNKNLNIAQKELYLNAVKTTNRLTWMAAFVIQMIGMIAMCNNLEYEWMLWPNLAVDIIPFLYATIISLLLLIVETRINKLSD